MKIPSAAVPKGPGSECHESKVDQIKKVVK